MSKKHASLVRVLDRLRARAGSMRGTGHLALEALIGRIHRGEAEIDEMTARQLETLLVSLDYKLDDLRSEAQQNLRVTSRTITAAMRGNGR
jgi:hypothetical protein